MYSAAKNFLERLSSKSSDDIQYHQDDIRVAIAVLYYSVIKADGRVREEEMNRYREILSNSLSVSEDELNAFEEEVLNKASDKASLRQYTNILRAMPEAKREEILRHMQEISLSDSELHEFELNLVQKAAELLDLEYDWNSKSASKNKPSKN